MGSVAIHLCSVSGHYFQVANIFEFNLINENKLFANIRKYNMTLSMYMYGLDILDQILG